MKVRHLKKYSHQFILAGLLIVLVFLLSKNASDSNSDAPQARVESKCNELETEKRDQCFYEEIRATVKEKGVDAAFNLFASAYADGATLGCHWTSHLIGDEAYKLFEQGKKFKITRATSYCGYGFYHGFLEPLLRDNPDPGLAVKFCNEVRDQLGSEGQDNCFHGIGHGFTEEPPDKNLYGNADAMLKPGLAVCEQLFGNISNKWEVCATGVYTVITKFVTEQKYGLTFDKKDAFAFCRTQPKRYEVACYGEFAPKLDYILNWDIKKIIPYLNGIESDYTKEIIIRGAVGAMLQRDVVKPDLSNYVEGCRAFQGKFANICFKGIVWGFIMHGLPEKEYIKLLDFCNSKPLTVGERDYCYKESLDRFYSIYPPTKAQEICGSIRSEYRIYCRG